MSTNLEEFEKLRTIFLNPHYKSLKIKPGNIEQIAKERKEFADFSENIFNELKIYLNLSDVKEIPSLIKNIISSKNAAEKFVSQLKSSDQQFLELIDTLSHLIRFNKPSDIPEIDYMIKFC